MAHRPGHIVLLASGTWTDSRQLCIFACKVVKLRPVYATVLTPYHELERVKREIRSELYDSEDAASLAGYLRAIALPGSPTQESDTFHSVILNAYEKLVACQEIRCAETGQTYGPLPPPAAVVSPVFTLDLVKELRLRSQRPVKLLYWFTYAPAVVVPFHLPEERGGVAHWLNTSSRWETDQAESLSKTKFVDEVIHMFSSRLIRLPGYEPIYTHEIQPQELINSRTISKTWLLTAKSFAGCDGIVTSTPACYDELSFVGNRAWMAETSRCLHAVGPLIPTNTQAAYSDPAQADNAVKVFADHILKSHGPKSLLYISFGMWIWPKDFETLRIFLDVVMELQIPFILSHSSKDAKIPEEVCNKVAKYQDGLLSSWCPQQMILNHQVTGWFVTHCGQIGIMEAITSGVPMICWPFAPSGALNAIYLTDTLKVAYELVQVRTGYGLKRIYRTGVRPEGTPEAIRGEARGVLERAFLKRPNGDGEKVRANLAQVQAKFVKLWEEGGESWRAAEALLDELGM